MFIVITSIMLVLTSLVAYVIYSLNLKKDCIRSVEESSVLPNLSPKDSLFILDVVNFKNEYKQLSTESPNGSQPCCYWFVDIFRDNSRDDPSDDSKELLLQDMYLPAHVPDKDCDKAPVSLANKMRSMDYIQDGSLKKFLCRIEIDGIKYIIIYKSAVHVHIINFPPGYDSAYYSLVRHFK